MSGERTVREEDQIIEDTASRISYFFDMIATASTDEGFGLQRILDAQAEDKFCCEMMRYLEAPVDSVEDDSEYESDEEGAPAESKKQEHARARLMREVAATAPYFAMTAEGVLVHLHNRRKGSDGQIAEELDMLQRIYIPKHYNSTQVKTG